MIGNLRETTERNAAQDWLNSNLARFSGMLQGQRDQKTVARLLMSEVTPLVAAHHGAFYVAEDAGVDEETELRLIATYGYKERKSISNRFKVGEALVGQAALEKKPIVITQAPEDYIKIASGLGEAAPTTIIVIPVLFEENVMAVLELASFTPFSEVQQTFLDQLGVDRRRPEHDPREHAHGGAAAPVAAADPGPAEPVRGAAGAAGRAEALERRARGADGDPARLGGAAPDPAGGAAADERGARGALAAAGGAEPPDRDQERGDRGGAEGARGEGGAARALLQVQVRVPGEHVARAAHAAQLAPDPREAARRQHRREPDREADRVRDDDPQRRRRAAGTDQRHPRPLEGRGREDGRPHRRGLGRGGARGARALLLAGRGREGAHVRARLRRERAPDDRHRPAAAAAGAEEPALERVQVHRVRRRRAPRRPGGGASSPATCSPARSA